MSFVDRMELLARRTRRRSFFVAASWAVAIFVASALALMAVDRFVGITHVAARILLTLLMGATMIGLWRWARKRTRGRVTALDVALELERLHPELRSLLATGVEFSRQDPGDPLAGSKDLRQATVLRAALAAESIDLGEALPEKPLLKAIAAVVAAAAVLAVPAAVAPQSLAIGAARLINPLSSFTWPRTHELEFVDPPQLVAIGSDFTAVLRDGGGALPEKVRVEYRTVTDGRWKYDSQDYVTNGDSLEVRRTSVAGPFDFLAHGGDDQAMAWIHVDAATAPDVETLELTVHPPDYTDRSPERVDEPYCILAGSTVSVAGRTSAPIIRGELTKPGEPPVPLVVDAGGREFHVDAGTWRPVDSGEWSVQLTTPDGLRAVAKRRLRIEIVPDQPPTVKISRPTSDLTVLPQANIDLTVEAEDDLGLRKVAVVLRSASAPEASTALNDTVLLRGPDEPREASASTGSTAKQVTLTDGLDLALLAPAVGSTLNLVAVAEDYAGQRGESVRPLRVKIISREQFLQRVDQQLGRMVDILRRAHGDEADSRRRLADWLDVGIGDQVTPSDQAAIQLRQQREVGRALAGSPASAAALAASLAAEYRRNRWEDDQPPARLDRLTGQLDGLASEAVPQIEAALGELARDVLPADLINARPSPLSDQQRKLLTDVQQRQDDVLAVLATALDEFGRWSEVQTYERELAELRSDQIALVTATEAIAQSALQNQRLAGRAGHDRPQKDALGKQRDLAGRLSSLLGRMAHTASDLAADKPLDAARLEAVVTAAANNGAQAAVGEAVDRLAAEQFNLALASQREAAAKLQALLDRLSGDGREEAERRLAELKVAQEQLESLQKGADALAASEQRTRQLPQGSKQPEIERLDREQQQLAQQTEQLARRLEQLRAGVAAQSTIHASDALAHGKSGDSSTSQAKQDLEEASRQLQSERERQQAMLAELKIRQLDAVLRRLSTNQKSIVEEIQRLEGLRKDDGKLPAADAPGVSKIAKVQAKIREEIVNEASEMDEFPVFGRQLGAVAAVMEEVENRLAASDTGAATLDAGRQAVDELRLLADAIRQAAEPPAPPPSTGEKQPGGQPPNSNSSQRQQQQQKSLQLAIAQLSVLRAMQADLHARTTELEQSATAGKIEQSKVRQQAAKLAIQQRDLAALAKSLLEQASQSPDEESAPDANKP